jgi:alkylation response protein AidB-like acyl-CoA dehydrogenase
MISYELTTEQKIIQSTLAEFAKAELRPQTRRLDDESRIDAGLLDQLWSTEIIQGLATADKEERSAVTNAIVLEELSAADATLGMAVASTLGFVAAIADHGTAQQREELLKAFTADAFQAAAVAIMEPSFGFDVSKLATKATRVADGYILRGKKAMVPLAGRCSYFLVIAEIDGVAEALIVPKDARGVSVAAPKGTVGLRALELAEVSFDDVAVPKSMRLGEGDTAPVQQIVDGARIALAAVMTGLSRGVLEYVIPYTKDRIVHGTALAKKQSIAFNIADMHMDVEAMRWMTWKAAWTLETKRPATQAAQLAYTYASQQTVIIADNGLQALGGHGFTKGHPVELWYRNARAISVLEGAAGV